MTQVRRLGMKIRRLRVRRGVSQEVLAKKARISRGYLARLELGWHDPTVGTLKKLARALRLPVGELLK